jgi:TRAP-type C4-dicarboxylate transport system permease small subunit
MMSIETAARLVKTRIIPPIGKLVRIIAGISLLLMMIVVVVNAIGRQSGSGIAEAYEIVTLVLVFTFFFSICYATSEKAHLVVTILTIHFPQRASLILRIIWYLISAAFCAMISWQTLVHAFYVKETGLTGLLLTSVPIYPFVYIGFFALALTSLLFLLEVVGLLGELGKMES